MKPNRTLYWVKFTDQSTGNIYDQYFLADSISTLEKNIADIIKIKVIKEVIEL